MLLALRGSLLAGRVIQMLVQQPAALVLDWKLNDDRYHCDFLTFSHVCVGLSKDCFTSPSLLRLVVDAVVSLDHALPVIVTKDFIFPSDTDLDRIQDLIDDAKTDEQALAREPLWATLDSRQVVTSVELLLKTIAPEISLFTNIIQLRAQIDNMEVRLLRRPPQAETDRRTGLVATLQERTQDGSVGVSKSNFKDVLEGVSRASKQANDPLVPKSEPAAVSKEVPAEEEEAWDQDSSLSAAIESTKAELETRAAEVASLKEALRLKAEELESCEKRRETASFERETAQLLARQNGLCEGTALQRQARCTPDGFQGNSERTLKRTGF